MRTALIMAFGVALIAGCGEQYGQPPPTETGAVTTDPSVVTHPDSEPDPPLGAEDPSGENKGTNIQRPPEQSAVGKSPG